MEVDKDGPVLKMGSGHELRFEDGPELEETYRERAEIDLGETPERRAEALEEFRRLIRGKKGTGGKSELLAGNGGVLKMKRSR